MSAWRLISFSFAAHAISAGLILLMALRTPTVVDLGNPYLRAFGMTFSLAFWALPLLFVTSSALHFFDFTRAGLAAVSISGIITVLSVLSFVAYQLNAK